MSKIKNSVITLYAIVCVLGFAALVALSSREITFDLSTAVVGLYGFLCMSVVFCLVVKIKNEQDIVIESHEDNLEHVWQHFDKIETDLSDAIDEVRREIYKSNNNYTPTKMVSKKK